MKLIHGTVRSSDEAADFGGGAAVLMSETDPTAAEIAVARYSGKCGANANLHFSLAAFPKDGQTADLLLETSTRRLKTAKALGEGAFVGTG